MAHVNCPNCGKRLRFSDTSDPGRIRCPICKHTFKADVPELTEETGETPSSTHVSTLDELAAAAAANHRAYGYQSAHKVDGRYRSSLSYRKRIPKWIISIAAVAILAIGLLIAWQRGLINRLGQNEKPTQQLAHVEKDRENAPTPSRVATKYKSQTIPLSETTPKPATMSPKELFAKASPAVVKIFIYDKHSKLKAQGSGFFVSSDGLLITNYHVISKAASAKVLLSDGKKIPVSGMVASMRRADLALLRVKAKNLNFLTLANKAPEVGTKVYAIGSPKGLTNTISEGLVSGYRDFEDTPTLLQTTTPISPGSSGGPLLANTGEVVGITTASLHSGQNLNFAVPCKYAQTLMLTIGEPRPLPGVITRRPAQTIPKKPKPQRVVKTFFSMADILRETPREFRPKNKGTSESRKLAR